MKNELVNMIAGESFIALGDAAGPDRRFLDAAGMGCWELDLATGSIQGSPRHDVIFGYTIRPHSCDLRELHANFIAEDRASVKQAFTAAERTGSLDIEARIRRVFDGEICWVHLRGQTSYESGSAKRIAGIVADVTRLRTLEARLNHEHKIDAIGQLAGGVAHEFNNLLQVVSSGLQILSGPSKPERNERMAGAIREAVERGAGLCRQLLAFSRRQILCPEVIDLERFIAGMRAALERSLRKEVWFETEFTADLWPVEVDPGELELVILNLALNARDAMMPGGGCIKLSAYNAAGLEDSDLQGNFVRLDIADSGTGMTPEVLAHVFEPFFTTKGVGKGSGLGLAQTHGFARASGGVARITRAGECGTTVSLFLPRTQKSPVPADAPPGPKPIDAHPLAGGQVLLVEDDDQVAALAVEMINQLGYDTMRVASAEAALGALSDRRPVDIVFSDVLMPGLMNGVELAQEIRRRRPNLPVLLTSGFAGAASRSASAAQIKIISKPYRMDELRDALATARQNAGNTH